MSKFCVRICCSSWTMDGATDAGVDVVARLSRMPVTIAVEMSLLTKLSDAQTTRTIKTANTTWSVIALTSVRKKGSSRYLRSHSVANAADRFEYRTRISFTELSSEVFDMYIYDITEARIIEVP